MGRRQLIRRIRRRIDVLRQLSDSDLRSRGLDLGYEAMAGAAVGRLMPEAFALVSEASRRTLGLEPYDVQLLCAIEMTHGRIAEMKTGEGKTLTASLAAYLYALYGRGVHVVTFNDYLAERDHTLLAPIYAALGLKSGVLTESTPPDRRRIAYRADVTYGSAKEYGFDFLRDRLAGDGNGVTRGQHFALVDEADSILIDEARTPLIIGMVSAREQSRLRACCEWADQHANDFVAGVDYRLDAATQSVTLTEAGDRRLRSLPDSAATNGSSMAQLQAYLKNAITARRVFQRDKHYLVRDQSILIVDETTGRPSEDRQWREGIHQAIQAKERLPITPANRQAATVTIQTFFNRYERFGGMTGTALASRRELKRAYRKRVVPIPTHREVRRRRLPPRVLATEREKFLAVVEETRETLRAGRAVLIGARTIAASERISGLLDEQGVTHALLNARRIAEEALVVEQAGQPGRVTVATNVAGRGTDIKLHPDVREAGGLHVILTEIHESQRIDWQLIGRGSRQGDPGSYRVLVSFEDEILRLGWGEAVADRLKNRYSGRSEWEPELFKRHFLPAQKRIESRHAADRLIAQRQDSERMKAAFATGIDPFLNAVGG